MAAYLLIRVAVRDWDRYRAYMALTPGCLARYGGRFIARGGETITLEGPEETRRVALVEFSSLDDARRFYHSPEYQEARKVRAGACEAQFVAFEGLPD